MLVGWLCVNDDSSVTTDDSSVTRFWSSKAFQMHRSLDISTEIVSYDVFMTPLCMWGARIHSVSIILAFHWPSVDSSVAQNLKYEQPTDSSVAQNRFWKASRIVLWARMREERLHIHHIQPLKQRWRPATILHPWFLTSRVTDEFVGCIRRVVAYNRRLVGYKRRIRRL